MNLTVIIPFWNGHAVIGRLLDSLPDDLKVIIVDDHSDEPLQLHKDNVTVVRAETKGYFTGAVNFGIEQCATDVLVLNQDTWFEGTRWLDLIQRLRSKYALIGERITGDHPAYPLGYIHGTFMFMRRDAIEAVGLMDAENYPLWGSTCEWQLRVARKDFNVMMLNEVPGFHHQRKGNYGSAIKTLLAREPDNRRNFIKTPPEISVIIPCYNYGRYLHDAVNSLIGGPTCLGEHPGQDFQSFEIIIVDDGSTDNSAEIGEALSNSLKGVRFISQENQGKPAALNVGIRRSYGRYISILDADDMMEPWRLGELRKLLQENEHSYVYDDLTQVDGGKRGQPWKLGNYNFKHLLTKNHVHAGIMFPLEAWKDTGGYPEIMTTGREDWAFNIALGACNWHGVKNYRAGYLYRRHEQNRTLRNTTQQHRAQFLLQIQSLNPGLYNGDIDMAGCCPSKTRNQMKIRTSTSNRKPSTAPMPGQDGMVLLEYIGTNDADMMWWGPVTGVRYVFGGVTKVGYVDKRDVAGFLLMTDNSRKNGPNAFRVKPVVIIPVKKPIEKTAGTAKQAKADLIVAASHVDNKPVAVALEPETVKGIHIPKNNLRDPSDMTVKEIRTYLADALLFNKELYDLIAKEKQGKARSSAISAMEGYLA